MSNGLNNILEKIESEAEEERESILEEAREEAEEIKTEAKKKADSEKERIFDKGEREAETVSKRVIANARRDARQKELRIREDIIQDVFKEAKEKLEDLRNEEGYENILRDLILEGGKTVGGGELEVLIHEKDEDIFSESDFDDLEEEISEETGKDTSIEVLTELGKDEVGAIVRRKDGSVSCNNTLEERLNRKKNSIRPKIDEILFKE